MVTLSREDTFSMLLQNFRKFPNAHTAAQVVKYLTNYPGTTRTTEDNEAIEQAHIVVGGGS